MFRDEPVRREGSTSFIFDYLSQQYPINNPGDNYSPEYRRNGQDYL